MMAMLLHQPLFLLVAKIGFLTIVGMAIVFLLIVLKQIKSMNTIITQPNLFPTIQLVNIILIVFAIFIFVLGVVIL